MTHEEVNSYPADPEETAITRLRLPPQPARAASREEQLFHSASSATADKFHQRLPFLPTFAHRQLSPTSPWSQAHWTFQMTNQHLKWNNPALNSMCFQGRKTEWLSQLKQFLLAT